MGCGKKLLVLQPPVAEFQDCLIKIRREKGLSQEALAAEMGVSRQAVSKWENGDAKPDLTKLHLLADVLEISIDELYGRDKVNSSEENVSLEVSVKPKKTPIYRFILATVFLVLLALGSFLVGKEIGKSSEAKSTAATLPDTVLKDGVCSSLLHLEMYYKYTISAVIRVGEDARSVILAEDVSMDENGIVFTNLREDE